jgi:hypothetical protein
MCVGHPWILPGRVAVVASPAPRDETNRRVTLRHLLRAGSAADVEGRRVWLEPLGRRRPLLA